MSIGTIKFFALIFFVGHAFAYTIAMWDPHENPRPLWWEVGVTFGFVAVEIALLLVLIAPNY
jgi:hypothetical protein|tara:strand:+ start:398 stop:583 length:186 start_codon:yes stop_codon:yes gene_type:complete